MESTKPIRLLFFIFFISSISLNSLIQQASAAQHCSSSSCHHPSEPVIRFPFRIPSLHPTSCGYPGFDLFCGAFNQTILQLPNSGPFSVQAIDYAGQKIWLNDPENCLPKRLLHLNLSGSPFDGFFYQEFAFFNCTFDYRRYKFNPIGCLSGENYAIFASSSERATKFLADNCGWVATVPVPVQWEFSEVVETSDLSNDIRLTWASPHCRRCESRGGQCGFRTQNSTETVCRHIDGHGLPRVARYAILVGAGVPGFLFFLGFVYFLCRRLTGYSGRRHAIMDFSIVAAPYATARAGLDGPTIESYPKTVIGESRRLPKLDDSVCSICLSEYVPKDTLRSIPECQHCFHVECIDEWLRLNPSCPVCRNSPNTRSN